MALLGSLRSPISLGACSQANVTPDKRNTCSVSDNKSQLAAHKEGIGNSATEAVPMRAASAYIFFKKPSFHLVSESDLSKPSLIFA